MFIGLLFLIWVVPQTVGHSPYDLELDYDPTEEVLSAEFSHSVSNSTEHYIEFVVISINGNQKINQSYENQPSDNPFTYEYGIKASDGEEIKVFAQCNQGGNITQSITVTIKPDGINLIPGFIGFSSIIGVSIGLILFHYRKSGIVRHFNKANQKN